METGTSGLFDPPFTIDLLKKAMAELAAIPKNDKWIIVTPEGVMHLGTEMQVLSLIVKRHAANKPFLPLQFDPTL